MVYVAHLILVTSLCIISPLIIFIKFQFIKFQLGVVQNLPLL